MARISKSTTRISRTFTVFPLQRIDYGSDFKQSSTFQQQNDLSRTQPGH